MENAVIKSFKYIMVKYAKLGKYKRKTDALKLIIYIFGKSQKKENRKHVRYTGGYGVAGYDPVLCCNAMYIIKKFYKKTDIKLRSVYHIIVSFPEYIDDANIVKLISDDICKYFYNNGFQCVYCVHENTPNLHTHIVMNSTNFITGKQADSYKKTLEDTSLYLKKTAYQILKENGY